MDYQQFITVMKEKVALLLGNGMTLQIHTTLKNNGRERVGLTIADEKVNIFPTIYLEEYYKQYLDGYTLEEIAESIFRVYHEVKFEHVWHISTIKDFSIIKSKIVYKLIHAEKNKILLQNIPHVLYMDLAIAFYVLFDVDESGLATIPITNELMALWNTNPEEILQLASENTAKLLPANFKPMRVVIEELMGNECEHNMIDDDIMFVLSNPLRNLGAACILYDGVLETIGQQLHESFFILPSSIHEVIIVPENQCPTRDILIEMIVEINETQVDAEEVLSDNVYYYDWQQKTLS